MTRKSIPNAIVVGFRHPRCSAAAAGAGDDAASEASTAVLRREVGAVAAARQRKGGDVEVRCARPGCGHEEPLLSRRRERMKKCRGCHAVYYCSAECQRLDRP
eukprot:gene731-4230_t